MSGLNQRQEAFAREYIKTGNGTQSAITAGYSPNGAEVTASKLLRNPKVADRIRELQMEVKEVFDTSVEFKKKELLDVIRLGKQQLYDAQGNARPTDLKAIIAAISELNRMDGDHAAIKTDNKHSLDGLTDAEIDARLKVILGK